MNISKSDIEMVTLEWLENLGYEIVCESEAPENIVNWHAGQIVCV